MTDPAVAPEPGASSAAPRRQIDWTNTTFLAAGHLLALGAIVYVAFGHCSWWTVGLGVAWFTLSGLAVTAGYHRLFSHRAYRTSPAVRALLLVFGAAAVQNSALAWCCDHRLHHARGDRDGDPYDIRRGFLWAHIGWILFRSSHRTPAVVADLRRDPLVVLQDRYYVPLAIVFGALVPAGLGALWGDAIGGLLVAGFLRIAVQWHATFAVNSVAHTIGTRPYSSHATARDSWLTALVTFGEGYHNFHHAFCRDYRNGVRWFAYDPTKWLLWSAARVGLVWDLQRTAPERIASVRARQRGPAGRR